jgi:hypothetical protein
MKSPKPPRKPSRNRASAAAQETKPGRKSVLLSPPPKLSEEVEELFAAHDFTELEYLRIERLRRDSGQTPEIRQNISAHDAIERRLAEAPQELLCEAHQAIDHGTSLLLKLIRSQRMRHTVLPTEKGKAAGVEPHSWDESFQCLLSRLDYLNRQIIRLAEIGVPDARSSVFYQAKILTSAFIQLAQAFPRDFRSAAESSLTMPSLRARTPGFSADAQSIAERIHLGKKHPAADITDNRERLGALCHVLIAEFVATVEWDRWNYQRERESYERLKTFHETADQYRDVSFDDWLKGHYYPTKLEGVIVASQLPNLKEHPGAWWRLRILPMVKEEFVRIARQPARNTALWEELSAKTPKDTPAAIRRRCIEILCASNPAVHQPILHAALFDGSSMVRATARYFLGKIPGTDVDHVYRDRLNAGEATPPAALFGISESGHKEDAALLRPFLRSSRISLRRAAVLAAEGVLDHEHTCLVDCFSRTITYGHKLAAVRERQLEQGLAEVARIWPKLTPQSKATDFF